MKTLSGAKDIRARLLKRVQIEQPDAVEEQVIHSRQKYNYCLKIITHTSLKTNLSLISIYFIACVDG